MPNSREVHNAERTTRTILFVSHTGVWGGGAEVVLAQLMDAAASAGYKSALATPKGELLTRVGHQCDGVYVLPLTPLRRTTSARAAARMVAGWTATTFELGRIIRRSRADMVHANSGVAALVCCMSCLLLRRPLIWHQHDIVPLRRINRVVLVPCGRLSARVIAVSAAVAGSLTRLGIPAERVEVVHNAVRAEFSEPLPDKATARSNLGLPIGKSIVAMAGRIVPYKGHRLFLDALAILTREGLNPIAAIAGTVPAYIHPDVDPFPGYLDELRARSVRPDLDGTVMFLGQQGDIRSVLAAADVLVVPSMDEPFPLVVLEGLASGVPVIASDSGGHPEAIRDGETGLLFKTGEVKSLAGALRRLLQDPALRDRLAAAGQDSARREFSPAGFRHRLAAVWQRVLNPQ